MAKKKHYNSEEYISPMKKEEDAFVECIDETADIILKRRRY